MFSSSLLRDNSVTNDTEWSVSPTIFYVTAQKYNLVPQPTPIIASLSNFHISTFRLDNQDNNAGMKIILNIRAHSVL